MIDDPYKVLGVSRDATDEEIKQARKSTAAKKSSVLMSGEEVRRGSPPLSPVKEGSKAQATNPLSAIFIAYSPLDCSFDAF